MGGVAFVFAGQGDQYPGMGRELYAACPVAARMFDRFEAIRPGTLAQCFEGDEETLMRTENAQPCLYALELAMAAHLGGAGVSAAAGFSLGEVAAAAFAGLLDPEEGFRLVIRRGQLMQREADKADCAMIAVLRLSGEQVMDLAAEHPGVYPVNFNCPGQVTVAGTKEALKEFSGPVRELGGRCVPLRVGGAFHSPMMRGAAEAFAGVLQETRFGTPRIPLYSDLTARPYQGDPAYLLSEQIASPVRWEELVRSMIEAGIETFVEIGPGRTLCGLIRRIDSGVRALSGEEYRSEVTTC